VTQFDDRLNIGGRLRFWAAPSRPSDAIPARSQSGRELFVAAVGDARDPLTWSGIPYHLSEAGKSVGWVTAGLPLGAQGWRWTTRRALWNGLRVATGDRRGGYQDSISFLERLWQPFRSRIRGSVVINCFQLYPPSMVSDDSIDKWFFIDLTLTQLFDYYLQRPQVGRRIAADAVAREREGYRRARGIITMSHFTAESVRRDYGISEDRIHVVVPGANLDPEVYRRWEMTADAKRGTSDVVRLVMVSTDWKRKGMDRLLRALAMTRGKGLRATLKIIGSRRDELPLELTALPDVQWLGRIRKDVDADRFLREVADADVGCILARYEAGGSVLREYHALGLAAFATTAGGMPDFMFSDASVTIAPEATDETIADQLMTLGNRSLVENLRQAAWRRRREATWEETVRRLQAVLGT
jgi:glycosyltransferase involved in cell wall biosynthesis